MAEDDEPAWIGDPELLSREIVSDWLETLPAFLSDSGSAEALREGYRDLSVVLVRRGFSGSRSAAHPDSSLAEPPGLALALTRVTAECRKAGFPLSRTLDDFARLTPAALVGLRRRHDDAGTGSSEDPARVLACAESVVRSVNEGMRDLARLLEGSARRAERERAGTVAALTDVLSHELRNRLGAAQTASHLLLGSEVELDESRRRRIVELIVSSIEEGLRTVGDVRRLAVAAVSDVEGGATRPVELARLVRQVVEELESTALEAGVDLEIVDDIPDLPVDPSRLRLILFNLLGNGIKYRDETEVRPVVRISARRLESAGHIEIRIRDNGIGIAPEAVEGIFAYRVRGEDDDGVPGSGLGLAIASEAAEQMGGDIRVESSGTGGTTFVLTFPPADSEESRE